MITTRIAPAVKKPFSWSYSRLKNFETCPKRHLKIDVLKEVKEEASDEANWGFQVHAALAKRVSKLTPLPANMTQYEPMAAHYTPPAGAELYVEQQLAISKAHGPTDWFDGGAEPRPWLRAVSDYTRLSPSGSAARAVDWKTGKQKHDSVQLGLVAAVLFAHYPKLEVVATEFVWLAEGVATRSDFRRAEMVGFWADLWPRISAMEQAHAISEYPARPSGICRNYCPVKSCQHHPSNT